jgi:SAM-dependent methyltransferase
MEVFAASSSQPTFRDPAGSVELRPDGAFRSVYHPYAAEILEFLATPLSARLVEEGRVVASEVVQPGGNGEPLLLRHPRVAFASYPWEWLPVLWLAAAELTLSLCAELLQEGWILKDATPLNILFQGTRPIFVDVLSIQRADLSRPTWYAYGQFARTFLLPMLAHSQLGWPLQSVITRRDGFEPEEVYAALPWLRRFKQPALTSVTLPKLLAKKGATLANSMAARTASDPELTKQVIANTLSGLRAAMRKAMPSQRRSAWSNYVETASHYSEEDHASKHRFITSVLTRCPPKRVLDIGCNTGAYSKVAADAGAEVVSIDADSSAVDRLCVELQGTDRNILPLCVDLAYPTPATGWENNENASFLDRANGHFDTILMLAVIHHLLLSSQIPLGHIASLCSRLTTKNLLIEWVPPTDPKFIEVLRGREALYQHLSEASFRRAFSQHFDTAQEITLTNGRVLLHLIKR